MGREVPSISPGAMVLKVFSFLAKLPEEVCATALQEGIWLFWNCTPVMGTEHSLEYKQGSISAPFFSPAFFLSNLLTFPASTAQVKAFGFHMIFLKVYLGKNGC